jgi:hypothetical protein
MADAWTMQQRLALKQKKVCTEDLKTDLATGKEVLLTVLNGGALTAQWESNAFLKSLQTAARFLRFLACT